MTVLMRTPGYSHPFDKIHNEGKTQTRAWKDEQKFINEKKKEIILKGGQQDKDSAVRVVFHLSDMNNREQKNKCG